MLLLMPLFFVAALTSCGGDEDSNEKVENLLDLPGTWTLLGIEDPINGFSDLCAGSKFNFKGDGTLYVHFANTNGTLYMVTLVSSSGTYNYSYSKENGMLYIETNSVTTAYSYKLINGRLYIYGLNKNGEIACNWQFERQIN